MKGRNRQREDLARFIQGEFSAAENRRMVEKLLASSRGGKPESTSREDAPCLSEHVHSLASERRRAPHLLAHLSDLPAGERNATVRRDPAFRTWSLCQLLIDECHRLSHEDVFEAEEMANLAITVAEQLDESDYGTSLVHDIHARAVAAMGNVLRITSDLRSADEAFTMAEALVGQGSGDALEEAGILELKAALRRDQGRISEAHHLLDDVIAIYRQYRDFHLVGRAFAQKGKLHSAVQDWEEAIGWLKKGLSLVDQLRDPSLELSVRFALMLNLHESGQSQEAWFMLKACRGQFVAQGGVLNLKLRWLEGKIQQALKQFDEAEAALLEARDGFIAQGIGFDAALVSLDLASLFAEFGRTAEMRRIAEEMLPIFQSRDLHREAIAALIVFQQAVRMERVSTSLLKEIGRYLQRARHDFKLRFEAKV